MSNETIVWGMLHSAKVMHVQVDGIGMPKEVRAGMGRVCVSPRIVMAFGAVLHAMLWGLHSMLCYACLCCDPCSILQIDGSTAIPLNL